MSGARVVATEWHTGSYGYIAVGQTNEAGEFEVFDYGLSPSTIDDEKGRGEIAISHDNYEEQVIRDVYSQAKDGQVTLKVVLSLRLCSVLSDLRRCASHVKNAGHCARHLVILRLPESDLSSPNVCTQSSAALRFSRPSPSNVCRNLDLGNRRKEIVEGFASTMRSQRKVRGAVRR